MRKKLLAYGFLFLLICCTFNPVSNGQNVNIDSIIKPIPLKNRKIVYVGGSGPDNYTTIQAAINYASDGDKVFVFDDNSPYKENIVIYKSIELIGEDKNSTIIDGNNFRYVVEIISEEVLVSGFTIQNSGNAEYDAGFGIFYTENISITENIVSFNNIGIFIKNSQKNLISNNKIKFNDMIGIYLRNFSNDNVISNNYIFRGQHGLYLSFSCQKNTISNNVISLSLSNGVYLLRSNKNNILDNIISGCDNGVNLHINCDKNNISKNNINLCSSNGINIFDNCENNSIFSNIIYNNNKDGIWLFESNYNNFYHNNLINNPFNHAFDNNDKNNWDNGYPSGGNYWDDYSGEDNNGDGIGDTPYNIPGGENQDRYPLMQLFNNFPPDAPIITGQKKCGIGIPYCWMFHSNDDNGDFVKYIIKWGDDTTFETNYVESFQPFKVFHTYNKRGTFIIRSKAEDIHGAEGNWSEFEIKISVPRSREIIRILYSCPIFMRFLQYIR